MRNLALSILCLLLNLSSAHAEQLKSNTIKELICSRIESKAWDITIMSEKKCVKEATFKVTSKTYNSQIKKYSLLKVSFSYTENKVTVAGTTNAVRVVSFDEDGKPSTSWSLKKFNADLDDNRSYVDVFNELFDNDDINIHNGDAGISSVKPEHGEADLVKSLEESLVAYGNPDEDGEYDFCSYYTDTGIEEVLWHLKNHSSELVKLLKNMEKKGLIKGAAYRGYDEGASEYCSHYYFEILTNDNKVIYVNFDFTT